MKRGANKTKIFSLNGFKSNLTWLILPIILLLVLVLIGVIIGVGYKKENSEKSEEEKDEEEKFEDYLNYKNEEWEFEIKYPEGWEKQEESLDNGFTIGFAAPYKNADDPARENVIVFASMPEQQNFDDLMAQAIEEIPQDSNANLIDYSKVIISGYPGYKLNYSYLDYYSGKLLYLHYFINAGDKWYQALYVALESAYPQYLPQVQAMIDSFVIK
ncbi:MAG: PsbP-related protein [bacterium]|nr:PsbP-related protein [bacterium]